ncbi:MAG: hypothetical protein U9P12_00670, partial [Verrucomicrobiota bacterium]|nr:hypothetical protein [Verrucomicrobiota bacterium]
MLYGHRRDPEGYAAALRQTDTWLARFLPMLGTDDVLILTADHEKRCPSYYFIIFWFEPLVDCFPKTGRSSPWILQNKLMA